MARMTARRAVLGDWGRVVRDPLDIARLAFLAGAVAFGVNGDVKGAFNLGLGFAVLVAARLADLPRVYDLALIVAMTFTQVGEAIGLYDAVDWYDRVVHVVVPMLGAPVAYVALARAEVLPDPRDDTGLHRRRGIFIVTVALGVAIGGLWEIAEWAADGTLGSNLSENNDDTVGDLIADTAGSCIGAGLLVLWTVKGWGSVRRIPGTNTREATDA